MNNAAPLQSISLHYQEGNSDKVYHVQLQQTLGGYIVNFQYGRRGSSLQSGTKTPEPVPLAQAEKVYAKLVSEKKGKGYTESEAGTPYSNPGQDKQPSGYLPQLANFVDEKTALALLDDDLWWMQNKENGERQIVVRVCDTVTAANRKGLIVPISLSIELAVRSIQLRESLDLVLDGEAMGDAYAGFDVLRFGGEDIRPRPLWARLEILDRIADGTRHRALRKIQTARTQQEKHDLFANLQSQRAEGVVFKRYDAAYTAGCPASNGDVLKFKFYATATLGVIAANAKRSVQLGAWTIRGWQFVGNVTIPPNQEIPKPLALVEVRYLYRYPDGALYQPTYLGLRRDKDIPDDITTLKVKAASSDADEM
jgi:bifunctional non-homologous end joining protein LigD